MSEIIEFIEFPKLARLAREIVVTEKLDGTNAQIYITEDGLLLPGSRTRWITPKDDNFGFAAWVNENRDEILKLGPGRHFGEWWGCGIQRGYGLREKRFSLFNVTRWDGDGRPSCCHVVPTLYRGEFSQESINAALSELAMNGSRAVPGFTKPDGVVVFHVAAGVGFKKTIEKDDVPKGMQR